MKKGRYLIALTSLCLLTSCSCSNQNKNQYVGNAEYVDSVEEVNSGYSKVKNKLTSHASIKYSYYPTYTPSEGNINMLALPILFTDSEYVDSNKFSVAKTNMEKCLFGEASDTGWESVSSFYKKSSFGKLNISGTVASPYTYQGTSLQFQERTLNQQYSSEKLLEDALAHYKKSNPTEDFTKYDYDEDGYLDGVYLIYMSKFADGEDKNISSDVFWAWCTWTDNGPDKESPVAGVYFWCSYEFMFEGYKNNGNALDAHTFIHETGHMLGLDDYYSYNQLDSERTPSPLGGVDMMDFNIIDHNAFSKFSLGWVEPYVIDKEGSLTIKKSSTSGDCFLIPTSKFNSTSFDEYIMVELFSPDNLNNQDLIKGYEPRDRMFEAYGKLDNVGIRVYHVDSRLISVSPFGEYVLTDKYISEISELDKLEYQLAIPAHTNTPKGVNADGEKAPSRNMGIDSFRLIQAITPEGIDYSNTQRYISNNSLFYTGGSIDLNSKTFYNQFPLGLSIDANNGNGGRVSFTKTVSYEVYANKEDRFLFNFKVDSMSKEACKVTFTKVG